VRYRSTGAEDCLALNSEVGRLALRGQRELAEVDHHRLPPLDVTIAACAHRAEAGVLHYDRDYDLIARHTSLRFGSEWLVAAGSL
jgi:predicted nucleic acid-binding protein